jgi:hypothetical protein
VRTAVEEARRERDEFRLAAEEASVQLAEVRERVEVAESSTRIPAELAVERHEVDKLRAA